MREQCTLEYDIDFNIFSLTFLLNSSFVSFLPFFLDLFFLSFLFLYSSFRALCRVSKHTRSSSWLPLSNKQELSFLEYRSFQEHSREWANFKQIFKVCCKGLLFLYIYFKFKVCLFFLFWRFSQAIISPSNFWLFFSGMIPCLLNKEFWNWRFCCHLLLFLNFIELIKVKKARASSINGVF